MGSRTPETPWSVPGGQPVREVRFPTEIADCLSFLRPPFRVMDTRHIRLNLNARLRGLQGYSVGGRALALSRICIEYVPADDNGLRIALDQHLVVQPPDGAWSVTLGSSSVNLLDPPPRWEIYTPDGSLRETLSEPELISLERLSEEGFSLAIASAGQGRQAIQLPRLLELLRRPTQQDREALASRTHL